jgi:hypothetical protein
MENKNKTFFKHMINGFSAGFIAIFLVQPLQVIRTSMMIHYNKEGKSERMLSIFRKIFKNEGINGFYRGFTPALLKSCLGTGIYFPSLEISKRFFSKLFKSDNSNIQNFLSSGISRGIQCIILNPILLIKTRNEVVGFNGYHSIIDSFVKIYKNEGFLAYFKGLKYVLMKDIPSSAFFYLLYEIFKRYSALLGITNVQLQASSCALMANAILSILTNPIDIIRTRTQYLYFSQNEKHNYKGLFHGILQIIQHEGLRGLVLGIIPRILKRGVGSVIVWTSYETLKAVD